MSWPDVGERPEAVPDPLSCLISKAGDAPKMWGMGRVRSGHPANLRRWGLEIKGFENVLTQYFTHTQGCKLKPTHSVLYTSSGVFVSEKT